MYNTHYSLTSRQKITLDWYAIKKIFLKSNKAKEPSQIYLPTAKTEKNRLSHIFPKDISTKWNANSRF